MIDYQKRRLCEVESELEDIRTMFREAACAQANQSKDQFVEALVTNGSSLGKKGLNLLLERIGVKDLTPQEVERIFSQIDRNRNGKIEVDEFMHFIYDSSDDPVASDAVFKIRKAHAKINTKTLMMMFDAMPNNFKPSFSQVQLEHRQKSQPASTLVPDFNYAALTFNEFARVKAFLEMPIPAFCG